MQSSTLRNLNCKKSSFLWLFFKFCNSSFSKPISWRNSAKVLMTSDERFTKLQTKIGWIWRTLTKCVRKIHQTFVSKFRQKVTHSASVRHFEWRTRVRQHHRAPPWTTTTRVESTAMTSFAPCGPDYEREVAARQSYPPGQGCKINNLTVGQIVN